MIKDNIMIGNIPAVLWGEESSKLFVAVHGNMSSKTDVPISVLADEVVPLGYQVLSFDLPEHGDRKDSPVPCKVQNCVEELQEVMSFAYTLAPQISLFACSMGAYFSLIAYKDICLRQSLFLSPIVDMKRIIDNMMTWFNISEKALREKQEIPTPIGQTLYWDYYCYVKENPIDCWSNPTSILYGKNDNICEFDFVSAFSKKFNCNLQVAEDAEHYFHTPEQIFCFRNWLKKHLTAD